MHSLVKDEQFLLDEDEFLHKALEDVKREDKLDSVMKIQDYETIVQKTLKVLNYTDKCSEKQQELEKDCLKHESKSEALENHIEKGIEEQNRLKEDLKRLEDRENKHQRIMEKLGLKVDYDASTGVQKITFTKIPRTQDQHFTFDIKFSEDCTDLEVFESIPENVVDKNELKDAFFKFNRPYQQMVIFLLHHMLCRKFSEQ